jgi:hypothetical protein
VKLRAVMVSVMPAPGDDWCSWTGVDHDAAERERDEQWCSHLARSYISTLYRTGIANIFGTSLSEATMRPNPRCSAWLRGGSTSSTATVGPGHGGAWFR